MELVRTPVSELSIDELETRLLANHEVQSALLADDLAIIGELEARNAHHADGHRFMGDWLTMKLNVSHETGARLATVARRLRDLPVLATAHGEGRITFDQLHLLTRIATADSEETLLVEYEHAPVATIALATRRPRAAGDTNAANHIGLYDRRDGRGGTIRGQYDNPDDWQTIKQAIQREAQRTFDERKHAVDATPTSLGTRFAEALLNMARARIAADADPDRATVIVHAPAKDIVDLLGLLDGRPDGGAVPNGFDPTEYADGSVVHRETLRRLLCDCRIQLASHAGHTVTGITSPLRTAPPHVQRALRHRDRGCRFPGCSATRFLHAHHIEWVEHGGTTAWKNLACLCPFHHRLVHEGGWTMTGDPDGTLSFRSPERLRHGTSDPPGRAA